MTRPGEIGNPPGDDAGDVEKMTMMMRRRTRRMTAARARRMVARTFARGAADADWAGREELALDQLMAGIVDGQLPDETL
jgi:hypothetical protein